MAWQLGAPLWLWGAAVWLVLPNFLMAPVSEAACSGAVGDSATCSLNYRINEDFIGGTGDQSSVSTGGNYKSSPFTDDGGSTLGDNAVGNSSSTSYQVNSGFNTTAQPGLTFVINTGAVNLGVLTASAKATGTATFSAKNYTSYGYAVTAVGTAPTNSGHSLTSLPSDTASSVGNEQFGLNVVSNPSAGVGADPVQNPAGPPTFGYGEAGDGASGVYGINRPYTIPDQWRYVPGETVASAPRSSGETDYTMTFMANISSTTPGGTYAGNLTLICTGTY